MTGRAGDDGTPFEIAGVDIGDHLHHRPGRVLGLLVVPIEAATGPGDVAMIAADTEGRGDRLHRELELGARQVGHHLDAAIVLPHGLFGLARHLATAAASARTRRGALRRRRLLGDKGGQRTEREQDR